jgi:hypothetical protein
MSQADFLDEAASHDLVPVARPQTNVATTIATPPVVSGHTSNVLALMQQGLDKGMTTEAMSQLVALYERVIERDAKSAFDIAKKALQAELPVIGKNREYKLDDTKPGVRYADLEKITRTIRPLLEKHGFTYAYDQQSDADAVTVICILTHEAGHSERYTFKAGWATNAKMSTMQKYASATTFGQRYSLRAALGLPIGEDDDARPTHENPEAAPDAPKVLPRSERSAAVTPDDLKAMCREWASAINDGKFSKVLFPEWIIKQATRAGIAVPATWAWDKPETWTADLFNACKENLPQ